MVHIFATQGRHNPQFQRPQIHLRSLFDPHRLSDPLIHFPPSSPPNFHRSIFRYIGFENNRSLVSFLWLDALSPGELIGRAYAKLDTVTAA